MSDTLPELANDDLDVLMEALEAWESKDAAGDMATDLLDEILTREHGPMPPAVAIERRRQKAEREIAKRNRKERSILLRAKLLQIRDRRHAEQLIAEASR